MATAQATAQATTQNPTQNTTLDGAITFEDVFAGDAIFTVASHSGKHYTYRIQRVTFEDSGREMIFAKLFRNTDDEDAQDIYLGTINLTKNTLRKTAKSAYPVSHPIVAGLVAVLRNLRRGIAPTNYDLLPAGRCLKCGHTLTNPSSVRQKYGPICAGRMDA